MCAASTSGSGRPAPRFTDAALQALQDYDWPGNVRELENVIQRLIIMCETDPVDVSDLPTGMRLPTLHASRPDRSLAEVEAEHIRLVLARVHGNRTRAAAVLGIDRKTLREKLRRLEPPTGEPPC